MGAEDGITAVFVDAPEGFELLQNELHMKADPPYTAKQGQYLAFIYYFTKIHGEPPSEAEMQRYFRVSPPSVHRMVLALESKGLISRVPGKGRSIGLLVERAELPDLE